MRSILPSSSVSLWRANRPGRGDAHPLDQVSLLSEFNNSQAMFGATCPHTQVTLESDPHHLSSYSFSDPDPREG